jgi:hypothetical protein
LEKRGGIKVDVVAAATIGLIVEDESAALPNEENGNLSSMVRDKDLGAAWPAELPGAWFADGEPGASDAAVTGGSKVG